MFLWGGEVLFLRFIFEIYLEFVALGEFEILKRFGIFLDIAKLS